MRVSQCLIFVLVVAAAGIANAAITGTYVDASSSNTVATDGIDPWYVADPGSATDGLWVFRAHTPMEGSEILESNWNGGHSTGEDAPQLTTTITGLTSGDSYNIGLVFVGYDPAGASLDWCTAASLDSSSLTAYYLGDEVSVETGATSLDGLVKQLQVGLGTAVADVNGEIKVYVDDASDVTDANSFGRSQYDGVTYATGGDPFPGDANNDGFVNSADAAILAAHWLQDGGWGDGDFNEDGKVDDIDATIMAANWGYERGANAAVPEPSTLIGLLALGLAGLVALRR